MPLPAAAAAAGRTLAPALLRDVGCHARGAARPVLSSSSLSSSSTALCRPRHSHQRRWAQVHDVRFVATTQTPRRVLDKYRDKLDRKARDEGLAGIDQLKAAYADRIARQRKADAISVPGLDRLLAADDGTTSASTEATAAAAASAPKTDDDNNNNYSNSNNNNNNPSRAAAQPSDGSRQITPLSEILDLPRARTLPVADLTALWRQHHAPVADSICAVVPASTYAGMAALARRRPQFVLPVPHRDQGGAEVHFLQWTFDAATATATVLFTQLAEYKARGEFAQPHTTATHYTDLAADRGVVLMRGVVDGSRGVKVADAQWLLMCLQRFYGGWDVAGAAAAAPVEGGSGSGGSSGSSSFVTDERAAERRKLLEWFGTGDQRFSIEKLLEETERLG